MSTGLVWDERFAWFDAGPGAPAGSVSRPLPATDTPESKERVFQLIVTSGLIDRLVRVAPRPAGEDLLRRYHSETYLRRLRELSKGAGGSVGPDAYLGPGGYDIARLAVGGCVEAIGAVLGGRVDNAYALVRPCGHHATRDSGAGFSILANVALAVMEARASGRVDRVAVVDWDVHHGNGTQEAFYRNPSVLTVSVHQDSCFPPNSGTIVENGEDAGAGYNINVPLPPGSGHGAYLASFERVVLPALRRFGPELIVIASGLDAGGMDPLGRMMCHSDTFRAMARMLRDTAEELCEGRLVACHEGGYSVKQAPFCGLAVLEALSGIETEVREPSLEWISGFGGQPLQPHQERVLREAQRLVERISRARV